MRSTVAGLVAILVEAVTADQRQHHEPKSADNYRYGSLNHFHPHSSEGNSTNRVSVPLQCEQSIKGSLPVQALTPTEGIHAMSGLQEISVLVRIQFHLLALCYSTFQPQHLLEHACPLPVAQLLLDYGREIRPRFVVFDNWRPFRCHESALELSIRCGGSPWFGFSFTEGRWWVHSWLMLDDETMLDPQEFSREASWYGVPWGREVYEGLGGRGNAENLPHSSWPTGRTGFPRTQSRQRLGRRVS